MGGGLLRSAWVQWYGTAAVRLVQLVTALGYNPLVLDDDVALRNAPATLHSPTSTLG